MAEDSLELLILLSVRPQRWNDKPGLCGAGVEPKVLGMLAKHSTQWAKPPAPQVWDLVIKKKIK